MTHCDVCNQREDTLDLLSTDVVTEQHQTKSIHICSNWDLPMVGTESRNRAHSPKDPGFSKRHLRKAPQMRKGVVEEDDGGPGPRFPGG